ncbi:MAG: hypothetical protein EP343_04790 [Deltaproteobacteria bacterium]|nr:MAG: hypothetical protein EP343_04790 [Deltaproteobacteria bacterium]
MSRWYRVIGVLATGFLLTGCVTKAFHQKRVSRLKTMMNDQADMYKAKLAKQQKRRMALQAELQQNIAKLSTLRKRCQANMSMLADKNSEKAKRLRRALAHINRLEATVSEWRDLYKKLTDVFKVKINSGEISVSMVRGQITLRLPEKVLFELGSAKLRERGSVMIEEVAKTLRAYRHRWQVAGHADPTGNSWFNWDLSYRRAMQVLKVMLKGGMPPKQVSAVAYGQYQPTATNETKEGRALNRRTEIVFVPRLDKLINIGNMKLSAVCPAPRAKTKS